MCEAYPPAGVIFTGIASLLLVGVCYVASLRRLHDEVHQAIQGVNASQDSLLNVFDRIGYFFRRLEAYTELPATSGMTDTIINVMVEVLLIITLVTKEINQGKLSELAANVGATLLTYPCSGRFLKKLRGRSDIEDALRRLDSLTQEEHRMATAQDLRATHRVDERMDGIGNNINIVISGACQVFCGFVIFSTSHLSGFISRY
jgi:hypothetical protein